MNKRLFIIGASTLVLLSMFYIRDARAARIRLVQNQLEAFAEAKLEYLAKANCQLTGDNQCLSHDMPDCDYKCQSDLYVPGHHWMGENLAYGPKIDCNKSSLGAFCVDWCAPEEIYVQWNNSPTHKAVLEYGQPSWQDQFFNGYESLEVFKIKEVKIEGDVYCYAVLEKYQ